MKLRVAAEPGGERGVEHREPLPRAVELKKPAQPQPVAKLDQAGAGLLLEQPAETGRAQTSVPGEFAEICRCGFILQAPGRLFDGRVDILDGNGAGLLEGVPSRQEGVAEPGVEVRRLILAGVNLREQGIQPLQMFHRQPPAAFTAGGFPTERLLVGIGRNAGQSFRPEDADPHFKISSLLHEHVMLGGV